MDRFKERRSKADTPSEYDFDALTASVSRDTRFSQLKQWLEELSWRTYFKAKTPTTAGSNPERHARENLTRRK